MSCVGYLSYAIRAKYDTKRVLDYINENRDELAKRGEVYVKHQFDEKGNLIIETTKHNCTMHVIGQWLQDNNIYYYYSAGNEADWAGMTNDLCNEFFEIEVTTDIDGMSDEDLREEGIDIGMSINEFQHLNTNEKMEICQMNDIHYMISRLDIGPYECLVVNG